VSAAWLEEPSAAAAAAAQSIQAVIKGFQERSCQLHGCCLGTADMLPRLLLLPLQRTWRARLAVPQVDQAQQGILQGTMEPCNLLDKHAQWAEAPQARRSTCGHGAAQF